MRRISYKELYESSPASYKLVRFGKGQKLHIAPDTLNQPYCIKARNKNLETAIQTIEVQNPSDYHSKDLCQACIQLMQT
jgi:hypothetical protein